MAQQGARVKPHGLYRALTVAGAASRRGSGSGGYGRAIDGLEHGSGAVKAELARRIAAIDGKAARSRARDLAPELDQIRALAHRNGMRPAVTVTQLLESALARGEHGALVHGWLMVLNDAVRCDRHDAQTCDAYAAACSVRFSG